MVASEARRVTEWCKGASGQQNQDTTKKGNNIHCLSLNSLKVSLLSLYVPNKPWEDRAWECKTGSDVQIYTSCFALWKEHLRNIVDLQCSTALPYRARVFAVMKIVSYCANSRLVRELHAPLEQGTVQFTLRQYAHMLS